MGVRGVVNVNINVVTGKIATNRLSIEGRQFSLYLSPCNGVSFPHGSVLMYSAIVFLTLRVPGEGGSQGPIRTHEGFLQCIVHF